MDALICLPANKIQRANMKKVIILILCLTPLPGLCQDTTSVLFIGNSYTFTNDLPGLWANLSISGGKTVYYDSNAPGGYWLEDHCGNSISTSKIARGGWDFVVLQEQSQVPTIDTFRYNSMYPSAEILDSLILAVNGNTMLYMTWGREFGGQQWISGYCSPPFANFFEMQDSLAAAYNQLGAILGAIVAPVGLAWEQAVTMNPTVDLWQDDQSHPTLEGSYLAACLFYGRIFNESPVGLSYTGGLSTGRAVFLQNAAYLTLEAIARTSADYPENDVLLSNYPNPFNNSTVIGYSMANTANITVAIYDILGREVETLYSGMQEPGSYSIVWDYDSSAGGIYFCRLTVNNESEDYSVVKTRKLLLLH